jgi:hypothetical protein
MFEHVSRSRSIARTILGSGPGPSGIGVPGGLKGYSRRIAHAIVQWCDGRPFQFVSEDGFDQWMEDETWDYDLAVDSLRGMTR